MQQIKINTDRTDFMLIKQMNKHITTPIVNNNNNLTIKHINDCSFIDE